MIPMHPCIVIPPRHLVKHMYLGALQELEGLVDLLGSELHSSQGLTFLHRYMPSGCGIRDWMDECDERFLHLFV